MTLTHSARAIIVSNNQLALAELMPGDRETVDSQCDLTFDFDHDDRPVPWEITTQFAALLELPSAELIGYLCWRPIPYLPSLCGTTWNLGIELIPGGRGRGVGAAAGMLLIQHLFASTEVDRIQMIVEADNVPGWRALEKLGMHREGVLRQLGKRAGKRRDMLCYSLVRSDLVAADEPRRTLARHDGLVLAEARPNDRAALPDPFGADPDPRISPAVPPVVHRGAVLDADTGKLLGTADWHAVDYGPTLAGTAWNVSVAVSPEAAPGAYRLLAGHLFGSTGIDRIESRVDADDPTAGRALEAAGFRCEGTIRGARKQGGQRQDLALYGLLRTDIR